MRKKNVIFYLLNLLPGGRIPSEEHKNEKVLCRQICLVKWMKRKNLNATTAVQLWNVMQTYAFAGSISLLAASGSSSL